jgi:hypothetical protein
VLESVQFRDRFCRSAPEFSGKSEVLLSLEPLAQRRRKRLASVLFSPGLVIAPVEAQVFELGDVLAK